MAIANEKQGPGPWSQQLRTRLLQRPFLRYGIAVVGVALTLGLRLLLLPALGTPAPLLTFLIAALFTSYFAGRGPGLLSIISGWLLAGKFLFPDLLTVEYWYTPAAAFTFLYFLTSLALVILLDAQQSRGIRLETALEEARKSKAAVREQALLMDLSHDAIITADPGRRITSWNRGAAEIYGFESSEAIGCVLHTLLATRAAIGIEQLDIILSREGRWDGQLQQTHKNGSALFVETRQVLLSNPAGEPLAILEINRDITERKRAEAEREQLLARIQQERRKLRTVMDSVADEIWVFDALGRLELLNPAATTQPGRPPSETVHDGDQILRHLGIRNPDGSLKPKEASPLSRAFRGEVVSGDEMIQDPASGECRYRHYHAAPLIDRDTGEILGAVAVISDVTERKRFEERLRESEERYRDLVEAVPQLVWTCAPDGYCDYLSRQWVVYTGIPEEEQLGYGWLSQLHPADRPAASAAWQAAHQGDQPYDIEYRIRSAQGLYRWFKTRGVAVRDQNGKIRKWFGTCTDIDDQKRTEEALRRSNEDLQQFAYVASHDLQEPLRTVTAFTQLLERELSHEVDPRVDEYMKYIVQSASRMGQLIRDLLTYSRATSEINRAVGPVDCGRLIEQVARDLRAHIEQKQAVITYDALPVVSGDRTRLLQVFQNLIGNALKYAKPNVPPAIHITARRDRTEWIFAVSDNGVGFDPVHADRVFGIFKRLHGRDVPGTGIGLALCKRIVERHGGRIWAESQRGVGTTVFFTLPVEVEGGTSVLGES